MDDVAAHLVEELRYLELFGQGHGCAGRLLAIAQCRVEDYDAVLVRRRLLAGCHLGQSFSHLPPTIRVVGGILPGSLLNTLPLSARPACPDSRRSGASKEQAEKEFAD